MSACASLEGELEKFFDSYAEMHNVTGPGAYKGQTGGYYTGGTLFARTPPRNMHPLTLQLPQYSAGCGGIDLFSGGFSYVNSDQLVKMMRNIGNNAKSLAFAIGLKTIQPMLANQMEYLNELAQNVNQFNINSCETAAMGLGMVWQQVDSAHDVYCRARATKEGTVANYFDGRLICNQKSSAKNQDKQSETGEQLRNINIAWKAIKKSALLGEDNQFAEFLMSLSGTIIFSTDSENNLIMVDLPSLISHSDLLHALVYGGEAQIYKCDTHEMSGCLHPTLAPIRISTEKSLGTKISKTLNEMVEAMDNDEELKPAQIALLNATSIPIYRILNVYTTYAPATKLMDIQYYSELISYDLLFYFLTENIKQVEQISRSQLDIGEIGSDFFERMQTARKEVDRERARAAQQANHVLSLIEKSKNVEKEIASQYAAGMKNSAGTLQR